MDDSSVIAFFFVHIFKPTDKALRDLEYDNLVELYYVSLSKTVKLLGSDAQKLFTRIQLKDEMKRYRNYLLIMTTFCMIWSMNSSNDKMIALIFIQWTKSWAVET